MSVCAVQRVRRVAALAMLGVYLAQKPQANCPASMQAFLMAAQHHLRSEVSVRF
jgi:hypothetical protein